MATIKKPAAKKTAAKKPAAKKPAVKKPAAKKPAAKKPAAKKAAAKKPAVKKPAAKKPAAKKTAAKKPAAKSAVKKPAVKKAAAKPAAKTASPKATAKPVAPVEKSDVKFRSLFDAYAQGKLPFAHGYILSSFFSDTSTYSIYEIVSYAGVKEIFPSEGGNGLTFVSGGKKLYVLIEPDTYQIKFQEPVSRAEGEKIPKRFNELEIITTRNQSKVMIAKEPNESYGSFTVLKPTGINSAIVFYQLPDVYNTLSAFLMDSLNRRKIPESDAKKAAQTITDIVKKSMSFEGEFK